MSAALLMKTGSLILTKFMSFKQSILILQFNDVDLSSGFQVLGFQRVQVQRFKENFILQP